MSQKITAGKFTKNVVVSLAAQIVSLAVGFVLNLIVPKFIDEFQYSYWQMYILYVGYVGVLHFGLLDGLVLRYSQYDYEELDKARIRSQFQFLLFFTSLISAVAIAVALIFTDAEARYILIFVALGVMSKNMFTYNSYSFQITNRINRYATVVIVQKAAYGLAVLFLLVGRVNDFRLFCLCDVFGDIAATVVAVFFNRGMYFGKSLPPRETMREVGRNVSAGIILMLANFSASLIIGGAKMMAQWRWDELTFGKVSFAFSLLSVFTTFITAVSVVLFPSLKRLDPETLPALYKKLRSAVSLLLFFIMIAYFPACFVLHRWLPQYDESLVYLGYLLPIIIFSSKVTLLTNNYLKVYRKERAMMVVNLSSGALGLLLFFLTAYVFDSLTALLFSIVLVIMANSVASEIVVFRVIGERVILEYIIEFFMVAAFLTAACLPSLRLGFAVYAAALAVYFAVHYKSIAAVLGKILRHRRTS